MFSENTRSSSEQIVAEVPADFLIKTVGFVDDVMVLKHKKCLRAMDTEFFHTRDQRLRIYFQQ